MHSLSGALCVAQVPSYRPHHLSGDPMTQMRHTEYIDRAAELQSTFSSHAVTVKLQILKDELPGCTTAEQAVKALEAIITFLLTGDNLMQIDAQAMLKQVGNCNCN